VRCVLVLNVGTLGATVSQLLTGLKAVCRALLTMLFHQFFKGFTFGGAGAGRNAG
jgi:hypothetical protein